MVKVTFCTFPQVRHEKEDYRLWNVSLWNYEMTMECIHGNSSISENLAALGESCMCYSKNKKQKKQKNITNEMGKILASH